MQFHAHAPIVNNTNMYIRRNAASVLPPTTAASSTPSAPAKTLFTSPTPPAVSPRSAMRTTPRTPSSSPRSSAAVSASTACPRLLPALPAPAPPPALRLRPLPRPTLLLPHLAAARAARPLPLRLVVLRLFTTRMLRSLRLLVLLLLRSWHKFDLDLELDGRTAKDGWILFDDIMNLGSI